jgi:outer membrane immunogenic protein
VNYRRFRGAAEAGYNWQTANFVLGIETDIELSSQRGSQNFNAIFGQTSLIGGVLSTQPILSEANTEKLKWLGTLRGRVGYAAGGLLIYGTGGLAYGQVSTSGSTTVTGLNFGPALSVCPGTVFGAPGAVGVCPYASWSQDQTRVGWTLGAGVEGTLFGDWSWKIEYLHVDLGNINTTFVPNLVCPLGPGSTPVAGCAPFIGQGSFHSRITDEIVRVGLNYKFGYATAPAVYK